MEQAIVYMSTIRLNIQRSYEFYIFFDIQYHSIANILISLVPFLCSLLVATSQFSVLIRQKMLLTGWDNGN